MSINITDRNQDDVGRKAQGDAYLSLRALSRYAGLSVRTLRTHLARGSSPLPHYRIGGRILVRRSEFDAWVRQHRVAAAHATDVIVAELLRGL